MQVDVKALQARAARHPSNHVKRFVPIIRIVYDALRASGLQFEKRYTNQVVIEDRWIARYEHGNRNPDGVSRIAIYERDPRWGGANDPRWGPPPLITIRNENDAKLFAATLALMKEALK